LKGNHDVNVSLTYEFLHLLPGWIRDEADIGVPGAKSYQLL
jgi:hypothetical protein